jgi:hypothetical protein
MPVDEELWHSEYKTITHNGIDIGYEDLYRYVTNREYNGELAKQMIGLVEHLYLNALQSNNTVITEKFNKIFTM